MAGRGERSAFSVQRSAACRREREGSWAHVKAGAGGAGGQGRSCPA